MSKVVCSYEFDTVEEAKRFELMVKAAPKMIATLSNVREWLVEEDSKRNGTHIRLIDSVLKTLK